MFQVSLFLMSCFYIFRLVHMVQPYVVICLYVPGSCIWANTPASHSSRRPHSASPSPSNSPNACSWLLPFRQTHDSSRLERGDFHVLCVFEPPSSFPSNTPPAHFYRCFWDVTCGSGPAVEKHWFRFLFALPPMAIPLWNREDLKEWNRSEWSLDVL